MNAISDGVETGLRGAETDLDQSQAQSCGAETAPRRLNMIEAINDALDIMMSRDENVIVMGEDVGYFGGVFRATAGLQEKHGKTRVFDTPISEGGIIVVAAKHHIERGIDRLDHVHVGGLASLVGDGRGIGHCLAHFLRPSGNLICRSRIACSLCSWRCQGNSSYTSSNMVTKG